MCSQTSSTVREEWKKNGPSALQMQEGHCAPCIHQTGLHPLRETGPGEGPLYGEGHCQTVQEVEPFRSPFHKKIQDRGKVSFARTTSDTG